MHITSIRTLCRPNVWHHRPVLVARLDLGELTRVESSDVDGFVDRLLDLLPGLHDHRCSRGRPSGFVERLGEGTYFGRTPVSSTTNGSVVDGVNEAFENARTYAVSKWIRTVSMGRADPFVTHTRSGRSPYRKRVGYSTWRASGAPRASASPEALPKTPTRATRARPRATRAETPT